ncbi:MAG: ADP-ribosylglycohydrolase family protein [Candidatus Methylacidiphilales bacterium]|nr:ADP-ribosylglycohydrolase family protein [Candidatus Methylacidiphilales bacterium]
MNEEFKQGREEGKDPAALEAFRPAFEAAGKNPEALRDLLARMQALPVRPDFPYQEPDELESIRAQRPPAGPALPPLTQDADELYDRLHGAWLGRCAGCALGKPFEGMGMRGVDHDGRQPWQRLKAYLTAVSPEEWPLRDFVPEHSPAESDPSIGRVICRSSTREHIAFMESDDDIRYTVLGLVLMREKGRDFTSWDVACNWIRRLPYHSVCTAETQAYLNLVTGYEFHAGSDWGKKPPEVDWAWVRNHLNPYREWIGAQIRVDAYGYAAAGNPEWAAELAWRDARISHVKNGIYGAMFCAAMIAASFVTTDPRRIVQAGLEQIPVRCRLAEVIRRTIEIVELHGCDASRFEVLLGDVHTAFESYSTVHTLTNAALCAMAVLLARGDFHQGITLAVMGAWDTDCNGATVGSIVGAVTGASRVPEHWKGRLNDTLRSEIFDYHPIPISTCARQTFDLVQSFRS